jgi:sporulation protein YlmC with PRC-barrel domain
MKYSEIRGKDVVDSKGEKVGEIMDMIFSYSDNKIELKYLVLGGGRIEELLEAIGARSDIDPVCNLDSIEKIEDKVYLNVDRESLKKTLDPGVIGENDIKFSALSDIKIIDSDNFKIGFVIDVWFDDKGVIWLVLGGGFFEELLERLRVQPDIDLLVPPHFIETLNNNEIKLTVSRFQLESTCEDENKKLQKMLEGEAPHDDARYAQLKLGSGPSRGFA